MQGQLPVFAYGRGFLVFLFQTKEDRDLIFCSIPYFMGSQGLYLNHLTPNFNPTEEITSVLVWVFLPHLLLIFWDKETLKATGDSLGKFIEATKLKGGYCSCTHIYVKVTLDKGLPKAILSGFTFPICH